MLDFRIADERRVRSISDFAEALGVTYGGAQNNINELIAHGVAEEVGGTYPKLIRFPGVLEALQVGLCAVTVIRDFGQRNRGRERVSWSKSHRLHRSRILARDSNRSRYGIPSDKAPTY